MELTKQELIEKLTNVHQCLVVFENLSSELNNCKENLEIAEQNLENVIKKKKHAITMFIVFGIIGGLSYTCFMLIIFRSILSPGIGLLLNFVVIPFSGIMILRYLFTFLFSNKKKREKILLAWQEHFNEIEEKFDAFNSQYEQEIKDSDAFFPENVPFSRHLKYGIDCLSSGRADNFKELMNLIDDLIHREKLEYEAKVQTENTRQQVEYAKRAAANSEAAVKAANAAAWEARRAASRNVNVTVWRS
jgi:hypothetical protein